MRKAILHTVTTAAVIFVPVMTATSVSWSSLGQPRSELIAVLVSASVFFVFFVAVLRAKLTTQKGLAISAAVGIVLGVVLWFLFDDAAQIQYANSSDVQTFVRAVRSIFSSEGVAFALVYAATVFVPFALASRLARRVAAV